MKRLLAVSSCLMLLPIALAAASCGKKKDDATAAAAPPTLTVMGSTKASASLLDRSEATKGGASSITMGIYALYISLNEDCTSPLLVGDHGATAVDVDIAASPTLFSASPAGGTYKCVIMVISDMLKGTPDAAAVAAWPGQCTTGSTFSGDICHDNDSDWKDQTGAALTCHSNAADKVVIFATTNIAAPASGALKASANQIVPLAKGLVVPGTATFYVDSTDSMIGSNSSCNLEKPVFGFR